jgi:hypothetical protein
MANRAIFLSCRGRREGRVRAGSQTAVSMGGRSRRRGPTTPPLHRRGRGQECQPVAAVHPGRAGSFRCRHCRCRPADAVRDGRAHSTVINSRHGRSSRESPRAMRVARHASCLHVGSTSCDVAVHRDEHRPGARTRRIRLRATAARPCARRPALSAALQGCRRGGPRCSGSVAVPQIRGAVVRRRCPRRGSRGRSRWA